MTDTQTKQRLFSTYVELTLEDAANPELRRRMQYVMVPPRPRTFNDTITIGKTDHYLVFHREQNRRDHRAVWQCVRWGTDEAVRRLQLGIKSRTSYGWVASPIIAVEMTLGELDSLIADPKTPYALLNRMNKVAQRKHGFAI